MSMLSIISLLLAYLTAVSSTKQLPLKMKWYFIHITYILQEHVSSNCIHRCMHYIKASYYVPPFSLNNSIIWNYVFDFGYMTTTSDDVICSQVHWVSMLPHEPHCYVVCDHLYLLTLWRVLHLQIVWWCGGNPLGPPWLIMMTMLPMSWQHIHQILSAIAIFIRHWTWMASMISYDVKELYDVIIIY